MPDRALLSLKLFGTVVALAGCAGVPKGSAPAHNGGSDGRAPEPNAWWTSLGDSHLSKSVTAALDWNPELKVLAANIEEARELARAERALGLPGADLAAGWSHGRRSDLDSGFRNLQIDPWEATTTLSWEIDLFGRIAAHRQAAKETIRERVADWHGGRLLLSTETAVAYLTQLRLNEERAIVAELEQASAGIASTLRDRQKAGLVSSVETGRQEAETESLRRAVLEIDRQRGVAAARLNTLQGQSARTARTLPGELTQKVRLPRPPDGIDAGIVRQRPDLIAAEASVRSALAREEASRLDLYPRLKVRFDGLAAAGALTGPVASWLAAGGPRVSFPALDPVARADARSARPRTDAALAEWESVLLRASEELETASIDFQSHRRQLASANRESAQLRQVWDQTRENFKAGIVSHLEVLEDQRRYLSARRSELGLHHQVLLDYVNLIKAAGGKLSSDSTPQEQSVALNVPP